MGKTFPLTKSENMGIFTPQRKIKSSYNLLKDFDYYLPDIKGLFILLALLIAGALLGNLVTAGLMLLPGGEGLMSYSMLLSYPVMFIPAMIYASGRSRFNEAFGAGEGIPLDRSEFGRLGFWPLALTGYIQWMIVNICDLFFLDLWLIQKKAKRRFVIPGTEGHPGYGFKAWMKGYALPEHLLQWPLLLCPLMAAVQAGLCLLLQKI